LHSPSVVHALGGGGLGVGRLCGGFGVGVGDGGAEPDVPHANSETTMQNHGLADVIRLEKRRPVDSVTLHPRVAAMLWSVSHGRPDPFL
jgi:hypothetical protein